MMWQTLLFSISLLFADAPALQRLSPAGWKLSPLSSAENLELQGLLRSRKVHLANSLERLKKDPCLKAIPASRLIFSESGQPFDGKVQAKEGMINLLHTKSLAPADFLALVVHEAVHLTHNQVIAEELYGLRALYEEGQAVYASIQVFPDFDLLDFLAWQRVPGREEIPRVCQAPWTAGFFRKNLADLFIPPGTSQPLYPRLGYWIGYSMFRELAGGRAWCGVSFAEFLEKSRFLFEKIKPILCEVTSAYSIAI